MKVPECLLLTTSTLAPSVVSHLVRSRVPTYRYETPPHEQRSSSPNTKGALTPHDMSTTSAQNIPIYITETAPPTPPAGATNIPGPFQHRGAPSSYNPAANMLKNPGLRDAANLRELWLAAHGFDNRNRAERPRPEVVAPDNPTADTSLRRVWLEVTMTIHRTHARTPKRSATSPEGKRNAGQLTCTSCVR